MLQAQNILYFQFRHLHPTNLLTVRQLTHQVSVGWATAGIDAPHYHERMTEIYLVAQGTARARVVDEAIALRAGDLLAFSPGEAHTFRATSDSYLHFVIHAPALPDGEAYADHAGVARDRLGL